MHWTSSWPARRWTRASPAPPPQWCGPCRKFTPLFAVTYEDQPDKSEVEVVFVSSDHDKEGFEEYYAEQPWAAVPFDAACKDALGYVIVASSTNPVPETEDCIRASEPVDGKPSNGRLFFDDTPGWADGIRCDTEGNVWGAMTGGPGYDGVAIFAPDGTLIGRILLPERCANLAFGGRKRNRLFMTASQSVYALYVEAQGCPGG